MSNQDLERLEALRKLNASPEWKNGELYRLMYKHELYIVAYEKLKSKPGNMTPGADGTTLDGFSPKTIENIITQMRDESFQFSRARRVHIPKANGKTRPLGIAPPRDKIVQEVMRMILEAIYDSPHGPSFSENSHGFRSNKGCHTALKSIRHNWSGVSWIIEGDVKAAFDNIDHDLLIGTIRKRITDERFINLIRKALTAGYYEFNRPVNSIVGTPQGSIVSPILCNIFLNELDKFVEGRIKIYEKGEKRRTSTEYNYRQKGIEKIRKKLNELPSDAENRRELVKELKALLIEQKNSSTVRNDGEYIRVKYVRYADDWCVGLNGPRQLAEKLRDEIKNFMTKELGLTLNMEKTHIRHAKDEEAFFLGTRVKVGSNSQKVVSIFRNGKKFDKRVTGWLPQLLAPCDKLVTRLNSRGHCDVEGNPTTKNAWIALSDDQVVLMAGAVLRGLVNYYSFVDNYSRLARIQYILQHSAAKTLAAKHKTSVRSIFRKHGHQLKVTKKLESGKTIVTSLPLTLEWKTEPNRFPKVAAPTPDYVFQQNLRLRTRSKLGENCAICGSDENVSMHHIRHIRKMGNTVKGFALLMAMLNRKQIPACAPCHVKIHNGKYDGIRLIDLYDPILASR